MPLGSPETLSNAGVTQGRDKNQRHNRRAKWECKHVVSHRQNTNTAAKKTEAFWNNHTAGLSLSKYTSYIHK